MDQRAPLKVGIAAIIGLGGLIGAWMFLAHLDWDSYPVRVVFPDTRGLQLQAPVRMRGVKIGTVKSIELDLTTRKPVVTLRILSRYRQAIPVDSRILITTGLLVTNPQVEIIPGTSSDVMSPETVYQGEEPLSTLAQISPETDRIVKQFSASLDALTPKLTRSMEHVEGILRRTETMVADFGVISSRARRIAANPQLEKTINAALVDIEAIASNARKTTEAFGGELQALMKRNGGRVDDLVTGLLDLLQRFTDTVDAARGLVTRLAEQVNDPRLQQSLQETLDLTKATIARFNQVASDVHMLLGDAAVQGDLKATLTSVRDATESGKKVAADVSRLVERLNLPTGGPRFGIGQPNLDIEFGGRGRTPHFRSNVGVRFPVGKGNTFNLGVFDFAESNKLTAQYGTGLEGLGTFRYGLYASKLGLGLDMNAPSGVQVVLDAYNPNSLTVDARAFFKLNDDFSLWVGADSVFRQTTPSMGVRLRR
jgi:phospholipid/cholesterol/gamma-HCH transport system substrate-binding protein